MVFLCYIALVLVLFSCLLFVCKHASGVFYCHASEDDTELKAPPPTRDDTIELSFDESLENGNAEPQVVTDAETMPHKAEERTLVLQEQSVPLSQSEVESKVEMSGLKQRIRVAGVALHSSEFEAQEADEHKLPKLSVDVSETQEIQTYELPKLTKEYKKPLGILKKPTWHAPPSARGVPPPYKNFVWPPSSAPPKPIIPYWRITSHPSSMFGPSAEPEDNMEYHKYHYDYSPTGEIPSGLQYSPGGIISSPNVVKFSKSEHISEREKRPPSPLREMMRRDATRASLPAGSRTKRGRYDAYRRTMDDVAMLGIRKQVVLHTKMPKQEFGIFYGNKELSHQQDNVEEYVEQEIQQAADGLKKMDSSVEEFVEHKIQEAADGLKKMDDIERRLDEAAVHLVHDACEAADRTLNTQEVMQPELHEKQQGRGKDGPPERNVLEEDAFRENGVGNLQQTESGERVMGQNEYDNMIQQLVMVADNVDLPSVERFQHTGRAFHIPQGQDFTTTTSGSTAFSNLERFEESSSESYSLLMRHEIGEKNAVPVFAPPAFHHTGSTTMQVVPQVAQVQESEAHIQTSPDLTTRPEDSRGETVDTLTRREKTEVFLRPAEIIMGHIWRAEHGEEPTPPPTVGEQET